jgi:uncharacterized protein YutE (UPF0331/DUF86 family)
MVKYDDSIIARHFGELNNALNLLRDLKSRDLEEFKQDQHLVGSAKYHLIVAIESAIDICNHIISKSGFRLPEGYSDSFRILAENKILTVEMVEEKLTNMARFRNRLVHVYWEIDLDQLYCILQENLSDLEQFQNMIKKALRNENHNSPPPNK